ncbi:MAG: hypothetical protein U0610_08545 [bacterium]
MTRTRIARSRLFGLVFAAALVAPLATPGAARAEFHESNRGNPFHIAGHLLAPVGNAFGLLIVEPFFWVVDNVPRVFELN